MSVSPRLFVLLACGVLAAVVLGHRRLAEPPAMAYSAPPWAAAESRPATPSEVLFGRLASTIAHRPVGVRCVILGGAGVQGEVWFPDGKHPGDFAALSPAVCAELDQFRYGQRAWAVACLQHQGNNCGGDSYWTVFALTALAHEAVHLRGVKDESLTQCLAIGEMHLVAEALGATADGAGALQRFAAVHEYPAMPADYRTLDCETIGPGSSKPGL